MTGASIGPTPAAFALLMVASTHADRLNGKVARVIDGDTLVVLASTPDGQERQEKIRLAGIDAPEESKQP